MPKMSSGVPSERRGKRETSGGGWEREGKCGASGKTGESEIRVGKTAPGDAPDKHYYHGTPSTNKRSILEDGLVTVTSKDGKLTAVYWTDDIEVAKKYGDLIVEYVGDRPPEPSKNYYSGFPDDYVTTRSIPASEIKIVCDVETDDERFERIIRESREKHGKEEHMR